jgi:hypothetical protein
MIIYKCIFIFNLYADDGYHYRRRFLLHFDVMIAVPLQWFVVLAVEQS